jgi:malonyl-CoA/methylmalonyl-CoA synthetase
MIFLPLNTAYTVDELSYFIENSGARMVVCDAAPRGAHPGRQPPVAEVRDAERRRHGSLPGRPRDARSLPTVDRDIDDLAAFLYTSGTTGRSKGAMLTQETCCRTPVLADYWRFTADDVLLHALPIFHTHGLFVATNIMRWWAGR